MKKPNYKDKEKTETRIKEYLALLTTEIYGSIDYTYEIRTIAKFNVLEIHFQEIDSTHRFGEKFSLAEIPDNFMVIIKADSQSNGIGQRTNKFLSLIGNLFCSLIFKPKSEFNYSLLTLVSGLAIKESVCNYLIENHGLNDEENFLTLKWINDIYYENKKVGGCLISSENLDNQMKFVISYGLNVNSKPEKLGIETTCLKDIINSETDIELGGLTRVTSENIAKRFNQLMLGSDNEELIELVQSNLKYKEDEVLILDPIDANSILYSGIFVGINEDGNALLIKNDSDEPEKAIHGKMILLSEYENLLKNSPKPSADEDSGKADTLENSEINKEEVLEAVPEISENRRDQPQAYIKEEDQPQAGNDEEPNMETYNPILNEIEVDIIVTPEIKEEQFNNQNQVDKLVPTDAKEESCKENEKDCNEKLIDKTQVKISEKTEFQSQTNIDIDDENTETPESKIDNSCKCQLIDTKHWNSLTCSWIFGLASSAMFLFIYTKGKQ